MWMPRRGLGVPVWRGSDWDTPDCPILTTVPPKVEQYLYFFIPIRTHYSPLSTLFTTFVPIFPMSLGKDGLCLTLCSGSLLFFLCRFGRSRTEVPHEWSTIIDATFLYHGLLVLKLQIRTYVKKTKKKIFQVIWKYRKIESQNHGTLVS